MPSDETPGADEAWARTLVRDNTAIAPLADRLDASAQHHHARAFAALSSREREALLALYHPTLADDEALDAASRDERAALRRLEIAFFANDALGPDDPVYTLESHPLRDPRTGSGPDYRAARALPDVVLDRAMAMGSGRGAYARAWLAAGHMPPPGWPRGRPGGMKRG